MRLLFPPSRTDLGIGLAVLVAADEAMFRAKQAGRNAFRMHEAAQAA